MVNDRRSGPIRGREPERTKYNEAGGSVPSGLFVFRGRVQGQNQVLRGCAPQDDRVEVVRAVKVVEVERNGTVTLRGVVREDMAAARAAAELRKQGKGFSATRSFRRVAAIDGELLNALMLNGDKDALDFAASGYSDRRSLRRLLARFPEWRTSGGAV